MIVIGELHAGFLGLLAAFVEFLGSLLPDVGRLAKIFGNPRADDVLQADGLGGFDDRRKLLVEFVVLHVGRGRSQAILVEDVAGPAAPVRPKYPANSTSL